MQDLQIFEIVDQIPILRVEELEEENGLWLRLHVEGGAHSATRLVVDGQDRHLVVQSGKVVLGWIPGAQARTDGTSWSVSLTRADWSGQARVALQLAPYPRQVTGFQKLIGQVLKTLLSAPGSNAFRRSDGCAWAMPRTGILDLAGLRSAITIAVRDAEQLHLAVERPAGTPPEEILARMSLLEVSVQGERVQVRIQIQNRAGGFVYVPVG